MKRPILFLTFASLVATSLFVTAAPGKKNKRARQQEEIPAVPPPPPTAPGPVTANPWHAWTASGGEVLDGKFLALENGILTVEGRDGQASRFPIVRLSAADQEFARACKSLQPRVPLGQDIILRAAARLDELIEAGLKEKGVAANPKTDDAVFVRRVYLDTAGRIPTQAEVTAFLNSPAPDKRAGLINTLLNSPGYTMHMFNWLADTLRVKDDYGKGAKAFLYEDWLKNQIAMNRTWDGIVKDMLTADGKLNVNGAAGFLLRDAQMPLDGVSNLLTTFLGANVSCAQCHDHPFADWTQKDFYGMAAFFGATDGYHEETFRAIRRLVKSSPKKGILQQVLGSNPYDLVDLGKNRLKFPADYKYDNARPGQKVEPALIQWDDGKPTDAAYKVDAANPGKLRDEFAAWMTHHDNPRFATNIANRVWKKLFGVAVQEPVSDIDDPSGAANPALLKQLTIYMVQAKFDLREFQRILLNTAAYQRRSSSAPEDLKSYCFPGPVFRRLSAEQAWDSILTMAVGDSIDNSLLRRGDDLQKTAIPDSQITENGVKEVMALAGNFQGLGGGGGGKKGKGKVNPRALGQAYEGSIPQVKAGLLLARASELPQPAPESHFLRLFGQSDRLVPDTNTTDGSVPQMLSLMNGPVQAIITRGSSVMAGVGAALGPDKITALYQSFFARRPTQEEREKAITALERGLTPADLAWVLLNSREFLFIQ